MAVKDSTPPRKKGQARGEARAKVKTPAVLYKRPNTAAERFRAMKRLGGWAKWFASLPAAERRYELRRLRSESSKSDPHPDVTDDDLTKLLIGVGTEWMRRFYPKADYASFMVMRPFGADAGLRGDHVSLSMDMNHDMPPATPPAEGVKS